MKTRNNKLLKILKILLIILSIIAILWFALVSIEFYRVKTERKPMICSKMKRDIENTEEYSLTCYGILYKYREYYKTEDGSMTAREFTLFFKEFKRKEAAYEIK